MKMEFTGEYVVEGSTPERIWLDHVVRYDFAAKHTREKTVLDAACGTGYGAKALLDGGAARVIAVDISRRAIHFGVKEYGKEGLDFLVGNVLSLSFAHGVFDSIVSFETMEHVSDSETCLDEFQRVLKTGGSLIISTPNRQLTSPGKSVSDVPDNPHHMVEYTKSEFVVRLSERFEILELYGQRPINRLFALAIVRRMLNRLIPGVYDPERGLPDLRRVRGWNEYRYIVAVCRKPL